jgi:hypothetical protein
VAPKDLIPITPSLTVVDSFFAGPQARLGLTARQFIRETDFASLLPVSMPSRSVDSTQLQVIKPTGSILWMPYCLSWASRSVLAKPLCAQYS